MKACSTLLLLSAMSLPLLAQPDNPKKTKTASVRSVAPVKAAAPSVPPPALTPAELVLAERVYAGQLPCELGASVQIEADAGVPGYFHVQLGKQRFHMAPVATTTGAIRLEDRQAGAVWLQLANKSMMVSDRLGKRLVDACMNPEQIRVAQTMEKNPVPSVLDAVAPSPTLLSSTVALQDGAD